MGIVTLLSIYSLSGRAKLGSSQRCEQNSCIFRWQHLLTFRESFQRGSEQGTETGRITSGLIPKMPCSCARGADRDAVRKKLWGACDSPPGAKPVIKIWSSMNSVVL